MGALMNYLSELRLRYFLWRNRRRTEARRSKHRDPEGWEWIKSRGDK